MLPLEINYGEGISIVRELTSYAEGLAETFGAVGRGIGAVMLLVVVFYYISSILDGGKFQIKMFISFFSFSLVLLIHYRRVDNSTLLQLILNT